VTGSKRSSDSSDTSSTDAKKKLSLSSKSKTQDIAVNGCYSCTVVCTMDGAADPTASEVRGQGSSSVSTQAACGVAQRQAAEYAHNVNKTKLGVCRWIGQ
jgi:hypothetical protein